ncbi:MAG: glycosyltransferase family 2 protein [Leptospiraceae bacterium]|nr:glycosyltransferase family 2 protein [Leptospiraceae bacterium]
MKISIITPSFNSEIYLERAIQSVLIQKDKNFEHIVVDGGSTDGTIDILKKYKHIKWISEKDRGQSDAMNKGFQMSKGNLISYLNADDYYEPKTFAYVRKNFSKETDLIMGNVNIINESGIEYVNIPNYNFFKMFFWWEENVYCFNPTGYFYRREVQKDIGDFDINNHYDMDYEFLLAAILKFRIQKVDKVFGNFFQSGYNKTQKVLKGNILNHYYRVKKPSTDKFIKYLTEEERDSLHKITTIKVYHFLKNGHPRGIADLPKEDHEFYRTTLVEFTEVIFGYGEYNLKRNILRIIKFLIKYLKVVF